MNHLEVSGLSFKQGDFSLTASFTLERGETGVILGPSGCGKTTLLRCIAGLERQEAGTILVGGEDIGDLPPEKRAIGFIFQDLALFDHLTGRRNIEFGLKLKKIPREEAAKSIDSLARKLRISELLDRKPFSMSGGEKQRLAFARAIATKPGILLMDEPLSSLDAPLRRELRAYLRSTLSREGITALHVTHDVEEALELGDSIFLMNGGKIVTRGSPQAIYENPPDAWCVRFLGLGSLLPLLGLEVKGGLCIAKTPYGRFFCPAEACKARKDAIDRREAFFYIPRRAASVIADEEAGAEKTASAGIMEALVERIVFQGSCLRVVLQPIASGSREEILRDDIFEIELGLTAHVVQGRRVRFFLDPSQCGILPLKA